MIKLASVPWTILLFIGLLLLCLDFPVAQRPPPIQIDPDDMATRIKIDRGLRLMIERLDRQTQADTIQLTTGQTADTIQLDNKYEDTNYMAFVIRREAKGAHIDYTIQPISDSSFVITKVEGDSSWVQWMTIYK